MPSDDIILNVRQIGGYSSATNAVPSDALVLQRGGLGGPYLSISPTALVSTALSAPGSNMFVGGQVAALSFQGGSLQVSNASINLLSAVSASFRQMDASFGTISGAPIATEDFVQGLVGPLVHSFNGRMGDVTLWIQDILKAGGAPIFSPRFMGSPHADTPCPGSNSTRLATTGFVQRAIPMAIESLLSNHPFVFTFNGRSGDVVLSEEDIVNAGGGGVFNDVALTGTPTAPTAPYGTDTTQIATTQFVQTALNGQTQWAPLVSPALSGYATAPTANPGTSDAQIATTAFVMNAVAESTAGVATFNGRTGAVTLDLADVTGAGGAPTVSPVFTGNPQAPTAAPGNNSQTIATTAYVMAALGTGGVASFNGRSGAVTLTEADLTGAGGALIDSPAFTGLPSAPTATAGTSTTQLATTAFVMTAVASSVQSFNGRTGAVTLTANDVSAAGALINPSVGLTGTPTAPTAAASTNTTQIATTAFVQAALSSAGGVSSFNGRAGAITLTTADVIAAGGAPLASPAFTGAPTAPTAAPGTTTSQIATTSFVMAALAAAGGVTTFNTRAGAVTLTLADITGAGGAPLASPGLTGTPTAPTPSGLDSSTALATTAWALPRAGAAGNTIVPAGQVGEVVSNSAGSTSQAWNTLQNYAPITLTPGNWLVWGNAVMTATGATVLTVATLGFVISPTIGGYPAFQQIWATSAAQGASWAGATAPMLVNITVTTTINLQVGLYGSGGGVNALSVQGFVYALRYR